MAAREKIKLSKLSAPIGLHVFWVPEGIYGGSSVVKMENLKNECDGVARDLTRALLEEEKWNVGSDCEDFVDVMVCTGMLGMEMLGCEDAGMADGFVVGMVDGMMDGMVDGMADGKNWEMKKKNRTGCVRVKCGSLYGKSGSSGLLEKRRECGGGYNTSNQMNEMIESEHRNEFNDRTRRPVVDQFNW